MEKMVIGVDPHKLSVTIEVVDRHEQMFASGRFATDKAGYAAMRKHVATWPNRTWPVEGSNGVGRPLSQRLLVDGEHVVDVPAKLAARVRMLDTGHGRKTPTTRTRSRSPRCVRRSCVSWTTTLGWRRCGCWPTTAKSSSATGADRQPVAASSG